MNNYIVYMHQNKINGKQYIGITSQIPEERWERGKGYNKRTQPIMAKAIDKYGWDNFEHIILYSNLTFEEASNKEKELIKKYKTYIGFPDCNGYNMTLGGDGSLTYDYKIIADLFREGKTVQEIMNIVKCGEGTVTRALRNQGINKYQAIIMHQSEQINQYNLLGEYIQSFSSISEASRKTNLNRTSISSAVNGKTKSCGGYMWTKGENIENICPYNNNKFVPVDQYTMNGEFIATYISFSEAGKILGISGSQIKDCANGKQKSCYGFKWVKHKKVD